MPLNMQENVLLRRGDANRAHIPAMPLWLGLIRVVQLVFTLLVMILSAYSSSVFGAGYFIGYGLSFYIFFWTILFLAYIIIAPLFLPKFYVYWVHLFLEFKTTVFWLATFALLASEAATWGTYESLLDYTYVDANGKKQTYNWLGKGGNGAIGATKAAAAFGAFCWALFVCSLIVVAISCYKHYKAKAPMFYSSTAAPAAPAVVADAEKGTPVVHEQPIELNQYHPTPIHA